MEPILEVNKDIFNMEAKVSYNHQKSKELLNGVRNMFQKELKIVVDEWVSEVDRNDGETTSGAIDIFYIEKSKEPIYMECKMFDDVEKVLDLFDARLNELLDDLDALYDNNSDLDEECKENLDNYTRVIDKCIKVYGKQCRARKVNFANLSEVSELQEELQQLFTEIISNYIIKVLFDALYERINNNGGQIYQLVVREINEFLSENGVYTKQVLVGDKIDSDYLEATADSIDNVTDDYQKFDTIEEIRRYPYVFEEDAKIIDGCVRIWRRND